MLSALCASRLEEIALTSSMWAWPFLGPGLITTFANFSPAQVVLGPLNGLIYNYGSGTYSDTIPYTGACSGAFLAL